MIGNRLRSVPVMDGSHGEDYWIFILFKHPVVLQSVELN